MDDYEFLLYCETHAGSERCGFTPSQIARLCKLAGLYAAEERWSKVPNTVVNCNREEIQEIVNLARIYGNVK